MRVTDEGLEQFGNYIRNWNLIPSTGGAFELTVNGQLLYSKLKTGRHMEEKEVIGLLQRAISSL